MNKTEIIENLKKLKLGLRIINEIVPKEDRDEIDIKTINEALILIENQEQAMNKLIHYIAVQENKDYEQVRKEFEIV